MLSSGLVQIIGALLALGRARGLGLLSYLLQLGLGARAVLINLHLFALLTDHLDNVLQLRLLLLVVHGQYGLVRVVRGGVLRRV